MEILKVSDAEYKNFLDCKNGLEDIDPDLSGLQGEGVLNKPSINALETFGEKIEKIREAVDDPLRGIAAIDIPNFSNFPQAKDAFWGCVAALAVARNIFKPQLDAINETPFTVYAASTKNIERLAAKGLFPMSAESQLGFHTDGTVSNGVVAVPRNIMLYNIAIEYEHSGSFHWLAFQKWSERQFFIDEFGIGKKYRVTLTPSVYQINDSEIENILPPEVDVPIFFESDHGRSAMYLNGEVRCQSDGSPVREGLVEAMRRSLAQSKCRCSIPQRTRRAIFVGNMYGTHARDVFARARPGATFNRIFMRAVDRDIHVL